MKQQRQTGGSPLRDGCVQNPFSVCVCVCVCVCVRVCGEREGEGGTHTRLERLRLPVQPVAALCLRQQSRLQLRAEHAGQVYLATLLPHAPHDEWPAPHAYVSLWQDHFARLTSCAPFPHFRCCPDALRGGPCLCPKPMRRWWC